MSCGLRLKFSVKETDNMNGNSSSPSKRSNRTKKKPNRYSDFVEQSPSKRSVLKLCSDDDESCSDNENKTTPQKPTALFDCDDVEGQDLFKFKSRHTKQDLQKIVQAAINSSPKKKVSPKFTPKKIALNKILRNKTAATPRHVNNIIKKRIEKELDSDDDDVNDFSDSSSEFVPDESEGESESSPSSSEGAESPKQSPIKKFNPTKMKAKTRATEYFLTPDNYFMMNAGKKISTSDHTLSRLKKLSIEESKVGFELSSEHEHRITELNKNYRNAFDQWLFILSENFNIILYGFGSKMALLQQFQEEKLKHTQYIVVNGFFPGIVIKNVLQSIVIDTLGNTQVPSNNSEVINLISTQLAENHLDLVLIVHNIDGLMLRNAKTQTIFAELARIKNIHMIATIDHINAPLLWDHSKLRTFNFIWLDVTTLVPYTEETSFENSLKAPQTGEIQLSSLRSVYQSLNSNAKGILKVIIDYQLENQKQAHYSGLPFIDLYSKCREKFLVISDVALRTQLTEFLDHKLVKIRRTYDGSENLIIPIDKSLLQQFLEQHT